MKVTQIGPSLGARTGNVNNRIAFKATPTQILEAIDGAKICSSKKLCLGNIAEVFANAEEQLYTIAGAPETWIYKFGQKNEIPAQLESVKQLDLQLTQDTFKCSPSSICGCGAGLTKGKYVSNLLAKIGVSNPGEILLSKNKIK